MLGAVAIGMPAARGDATSRAGFRDCRDCPLMIAIEPGDFSMGSPPEESGRSDAEGPVHSVHVGRAFALGKFDVTRAEFGRFAQATGFQPRAPGCDWREPKSKGVPLRQAPNEPVVCVDWNDAQAYVSWLGARTGKPYRLPSEAEWEYAARAGSTSARPWGATLGRNDANYGSDTCCGAFAAGNDRWLYTSPVGAFPPNGFGLHDMLGNVWQWTEDCGSENYQGAPADASPRVSGDCGFHIVRGGAWFQGPESLRSAARAADRADFRIADIGFRVARSL